MADLVIAAGEERAELIGALQQLTIHAQAFNGRGQPGAIVKAMSAFDAMRERAYDAAAAFTVDAAVVNRLRAAIDARPKYLAVPIDVADVQALLRVIDEAQR